MDIRDKNSILTEWLLKLAAIFYFASMFFDGFILETFGKYEAFQLGFIIKILLIIIFGILISVLEKNVFKIAAFGLIIILSVFKALIYISQTSFNLTRITELAEYVLIISISIYYLQRHFKKTKKYRSRTNHHHKSKQSNENDSSLN